MFFCRFVLASALLAPLLLPVFGATESGCPLPDDCPCMRRSVFDSSWLNATSPAVYKAFSDYTFSQPDISYPNCTAIVAACPSEAQIAIYDFTATSSPLSIGGKRITNPYVLSGIVCSAGNVWRTSGLNEELDSNLKSSSIACAFKN